MAEIKGKNKGEWSEMYIFFKLMSDRKVYVADKDMNKLKDVFLNIVSIIREEVAGKEYRYFTGDKVVITLNGETVMTLDSSLFTEKAARVWKMITENKGNTTFTDEEIKERMELRGQYIAEMKASLKHTLDNTYIQKPDGTREKLRQKPNNQKAKQ